MITQSEIDKLAEKYETVDFIKDDPIQFPHRFTKKEDIEIAGFIASLVAYGQRKVFIKKLDTLFEIAQNEPHNFILNFEPKILGDFNYRFGKPEDFAQIFSIMRRLYEKDGGLEELFKYGYKNSDNMFIPVCDYFYSRFEPTQGVKFMVPDPKKGGAMRRTHVARLSREMGLLTRNANDFKSVLEITENLRRFDPVDPIKYDFALFGYGINN